MNVAIILSRGGSKRIARKNIKIFCGKPMIVWTIKAIKQSGLFEHIIVSTDDKKIAAISQSHGAEVPFMRPAELSDDFTGTNDVMVHAVSWILKQNWNLEAVCCFYATSIFFTIDDLKKGFDVLHDSNCTYAFSATDFDYPIFRSFKEHPDGGVEMFFPEYFEKRSQDFPVAMHDAAQFYWAKPHVWLKRLNIFEPHSYFVKIPRWRVQDIDTEDDWKRAEILFDLIKLK